MTFSVELDDGTPLDAVDLRATLNEQTATDRVIVHLIHDDAELLVGFRGDRGVCYWMTYSSDDAVTVGGTNAETIVYGANEIAFPPNSELDTATVLAAADEFAKTAKRPTGVGWTRYDTAVIGLAPGEEPRDRNSGV